MPKPSWHPPITRTFAPSLCGQQPPRTKATRSAICPIARSCRCSNSIPTIGINPSSSFRQILRSPFPRVGRPASFSIPSRGPWRPDEFVRVALTFLSSDPSKDRPVQWAGTTPVTPAHFAKLPFYQPPRRVSDLCFTVQQRTSPANWKSRSFLLRPESRPIRGRRKPVTRINLC